MKRLKSNRIGLFCLGLIPIAATLFLAVGVSESFSPASFQSVASRELDYEAEISSLDTARYFEEPCYEYCQIEQKACGEEMTDVLNKTVIKIDNQQGSFQEVNEVNIKDLPANASLNFMIEQYRVERRKLHGETYFFVSMETFAPFSPHLTYPNNPLQSPGHGLSDEEACITLEQMEWLRRKGAVNIIRKATERASIPI